MSSTKQNGGKLVSKLAAIAGELGGMKREGRNEYHGYDYFTEDQLTAVLRPKLAKRNLATTFSVETVESREIKNQKGNIEQLVTITTSHKIIDGDTGEELECKSAGMGADSADKGLYKAMTGAMKYFLMKTFFISDQMDAEGDIEIDKAHHEKHRPTTRYEDKKAKGTPASEADLDTLQKWLAEEEIDEDFVMKLAKEGKLSDKEKSLDELKPGTLTRLLTLRKRIKERWLLASKGTDTTRVFKKGKSAPRKREAEDEDQTPNGARQPLQTDLSPEEYLEQEGVENWEDVKIHFGTKEGTRLGDLGPRNLKWWIEDWKAKKFKGKYSDGDYLLDAALCVAQKAKASDEEDNGEISF
jgi:ERF superfamily protein